MILYVDAGGTKTRVWTRTFKTTFPTDLKNLPITLRKLIRLLGNFQSRPQLKSRHSGESRNPGSKHEFKWQAYGLDPGFRRGDNTNRTTTELIIGIRGVWTKSEKNYMLKKLRGLAPKITVLSDIELAHHLAFQGRPGIVLNAGTGSIAYGVNERGQSARAGGLGPLLGDEGSAFWIGKEYLKEIYRRDGNINLLRPFAVGSNPVPRIAAWAKRVLRQAERNPGSMEAGLARKAQAELRGLIQTLKTRLTFKKKPAVHVTGGLFENAYFIDLWRKPRSRV